MNVQGLVDETGVSEDFDPLPGNSRVVGFQIVVSRLTLPSARRTSGLSRSFCLISNTDVHHLYLHADRDDSPRGNAGLFDGFEHSSIVGMVSIWTIVQRLLVTFQKGSRAMISNSRRWIRLPTTCRLF